jgi:hypothetical protein
MTVRAKFFPAPTRISLKPVVRCPRCGSWVDASSSGNLVDDHKAPDFLYPDERRRDP